MTTRRTFLGALAVLPVVAAVPSICKADPWAAWSRHLENGPWILLGNSPALFHSVKRGYVQIHMHSDITVNSEGGRYYLGAYNLEHKNSKELSFRYPRTLKAGAFYDLHIRVDESGSAWVDSAYITPGPVDAQGAVDSWVSYSRS